MFGNPTEIPPKPTNSQPWHDGEAANRIDSRYRQRRHYYKTAVLNWLEVDKGHLVPRYYAGLDANQQTREKRVKASYTFFNLVPQTMELNGERWMKCERELIKWAKAGVNAVRKNAGLKFSEAKGRTKLYVIVGAVPRLKYLNSASQGEREQYFGPEGLGQHQKDNTYPVNFPLAVWTAACLVDVFDSKRPGYYTVFWNWNEQKGKLQHNCLYPKVDGKHFLGYGEGGSLSMSITHGSLGSEFLNDTRLFPGQRQCQDGVYKVLSDVTQASNGNYQFIT